MRIGPETPGHNRGHCHYDPGLTGRICGAPATEHLWIGGMDGDPEAFTTFTCGAHQEAAHKGLEPTDWHEIGPDCIAERGTVRWNASGTPGKSFCFEPGDDPGLELAILAAGDRVSRALEEAYQR